MVKRIVAAILFLFVVSVAAQYPGCEKVVDYKMDVVLHPDAKTVTGSEVLIWKNTSDQAVKELFFHAYLNAFKNTSSTFLREAAQGLARHNRTLYDRSEDEWGYLDVKAISATLSGHFEKTDLMPSFRYVHPDDDNELDQTVFVVTLPRAVPPKAEVELNISFESKLPAKAPRTGFFNNYFFVAQWFPKIGVLIDGKWNCHQFHTNSEFFADYGSYDVSITVPSEFVVGATGVMQDSTVNKDGTTTYRFQQDCVHDFAWTAYPNYRIAIRMFKHPELPQVKMRLLYQPDHKKFVDAFFDATANTLKHYGLWYVPYPYSQITIVDAAPRSRSGGMEYPTLFTTGTGWLTPLPDLSLQGLTVHECGHQFWYGLVGSNEFENPWMDEGFNSYSDTRCLNAAYGNRVYSKTYLKRRGFGIPKLFKGVQYEPRMRRLVRYRYHASDDIMNLFSWQYVDGASYGVNAYDKSSLMLWTLEGYLGEDVFSQIMKAYATRYEFKHPKPQDFIDVVNEFAPEPMDWFFQETLNGSGVLDYAVEKVVSKPVLRRKGYYDNEKREYIDEKKEDEKKFESFVLVRRKGEVRIPVDVRITFEDGEVVNEKWDGQDLWKRYHYIRSSQVMLVEVDPDRKLMLDINYSNNSMYRKKSSFAAFRWTAKWMYWVQHLFEVVAFFS